MTDFNPAELQPQRTEPSTRTRSGKPNPFLSWLRTSYDEHAWYEVTVPTKEAAYTRGLARSAAQRLAVGCELQSFDLEGDRVRIKYFARPKRERKPAEKPAAEQPEETAELPV